MLRKDLNARYRKSPGSDERDMNVDEFITHKVEQELRKSNLPEEIRIGAILRDNDIIIPRSNFIFKKEDIVVFLAKRDQLSGVENMFRISSF